MNNVYLYVYDISNGLGIYHTSVTAHGIELAYNAYGVLVHRMGESRFNQPKNIEYMGQTSCSIDQLLSYVKVLSNDQFQASRYDVYTNNCIDFCKVLVTFLCNGIIPDYVQVAPRLGQGTVIGRFLKPLFASCSAAKNDR